MSATSSPADPNPADNEAGDDNGDAIVVLTPDTATLERALAERAAKRQAVVTKKRQAATDRQTFGVTLMKIKNYEGAAGCFAEACKLWRTNPVAHCDLATAYLHLGRFEEAEAEASTALGLDPKLVEARYARAMARKGRGNVRGAIVDLTTVVELAPENASAQSALRDLETERDASPASTSAADPPPPPAASDEAATDTTAPAEPPAAVPTPAEPLADHSPAAEPPAPAAPTPGPEPDADADAAYAHPRPTSPPLSHSALFDDDSASDTSDALHTGTEPKPCLFYNTSSCTRGARCAFSHAPDRRSVRDGLGKNVCWYWLVGLCKFGPKCIYKHGREALGGGWWDDEEELAKMREKVETRREARRLAREAKKAQAEKPKTKRGKGGNKRGRGRGGAGDGGAGGSSGRADSNANGQSKQPKNSKTAHNSTGHGRSNSNVASFPNSIAIAPPNIPTLAGISTQHLSMADLHRQMVLFNLSQGRRPFEGFVAVPSPTALGFAPGLPGAGDAGLAAREGASAGFTEYVPPPRAAEATETEGAGGLSY
ncbi:hypothetical protein DFH08DRAFT_971128 [Mycena albidolilacea]|uniref:C3H1-type domain-containing protein n=1 Tax=Mycena albidolilacea TaxID=1033008 RepID=A0AAD6ZEC1_9AGAR|nr:hypothetical protein DFH08DRAFT_971128 [Mycena albidolilacea]